VSDDCPRSRTRQSPIRYRWPDDKKPRAAARGARQPNAILFYSAARGCIDWPRVPQAFGGLPRCLSRAARPEGGIRLHRTQFCREGRTLRPLPDSPLSTKAEEKCSL